MAWVTLGNGERVPLVPAQGTREHVGRIAAGLTEAFAGYREAAAS
jgi:hypothetical protein